MHPVDHVYGQVKVCSPFNGRTSQIPSSSPTLAGSLDDVSYNVNKANSFKLPEILCELSQEDHLQSKAVFLDAILDSGSTINCLDEKLCRKSCFKISKEVLRFKTSNGEIATTNGTTYLQLSKPHKKPVITLKFAVIKGLPVKCLLGVPFLRNTVMDFQAEMLVFKEGENEEIFHLDTCSIGSEVHPMVQALVHHEIPLEVHHQEHESAVQTLLTSSENVSEGSDTDVGNKAKIIQGHSDVKGLANLEASPNDFSLDSKSVVDDMFPVLPVPTKDDMSVMKLPTEMTPVQQAKLQSLIMEYKSIFKVPDNPADTEYSGWNNRPLELKLTSDTFSRPRHIPTVPQELRDSWLKQIDQWEARGIIEVQTEKTPFLHGFVPVAKPDGSVRWTLDVRPLNHIVENETVSLPPPEEIVMKMAKFPILSKFDFSSFYLSFKCSPKTSSMLTFLEPVTGRMMKFIRTPFGLKGSSMHSTQLTTQLLDSGLSWYQERCALFVDDLILGSYTLDQMIEDLEELFRVVKSSNLRFKPQKVEIGQKSIELFGYTIENGGFKVSADRTASLVNIPPPKNQKDLLKAFGCLSYYRHSWPPHSPLAKHQSFFEDLLKKNAEFKWLSKHSFRWRQMLKAAARMITRTVVYPGEEIQLRADSSKHYMGYVISVNRDGKELIVSTGSRKWPEVYHRYHSSRLELIGLLVAMGMVKHMLYNHPVVVHTDNGFAHFILSNRSRVLLEEPSLISRLLMSIAGVNFRVAKATNEMKSWDLVDRLSRQSSSLVISKRNVEEILKTEEEVAVKILTCSKIYEPCDMVTEDFQLETSIYRVNEVRRMASDIHQSKPFKEAKDVPLEFRRKVLHQIHLLGHLGVPRMLAIANHLELSWPNRRVMAAEVVQQCDTCSKRKPPNRLLLSQDTTYNTSYPGQCLAIDVNSIGHVNGVHILVVCDVHTEFTSAYSLARSITTEKVIEKLLLHIVRMAPFVQMIRLDNAAYWVNPRFKNIFEQMNIKLSYSARFNSRAQSLPEKKNKQLNQQLRLNGVNPFKSTFQMDLEAILLFINLAPNERFGLSPIELYFGIQLDRSAGPVGGFMTKPEFQDHLRSLTGLREVLHFFRGTPLPQFKMKIGIGSLVRLYTHQRVGENKISKLTYTDKIFKVVDVNKFRLTLKVREVDKDEEVLNPESEPIVSHVRHVRVVKLVPPEEVNAVSGADDVIKESRAVIDEAQVNNSEQDNLTNGATKAATDVKADSVQDGQKSGVQNQGHSSTKRNTRYGKSMADKPAAGKHGVTNGATKAATDSGRSERINEPRRSARLKNKRSNGNKRTCSMCLLVHCHRSCPEMSW